MNAPPQPAPGGLVRWKAIIPLAVFLGLLVAIWAIFGDWLVRRELESVLSAVLGTEVDLARLRIRETDAAVDLYGLQVADPRDSSRNVIEAATIVLDLSPRPLLQKKVVVDRLTLSGLRFGARREHPARPADHNGTAGRLLRETEAWAADKFRFPPLAMGRVDTLKKLVLHPDQLQTAKAADSIVAAADSLRSGLTANLDRLKLKPLVDSANTQAQRLAKTDPKRLGLAGIKETATSVRRTLDGLQQARSRLDSVTATSRTALASLDQAAGVLEAARQRDYALARGLLQLPALEGPDIGRALFGGRSVDYFQRGLYYGKLAQQYVPPGLQPWNSPGPKRLRREGTSVQFPKRDQYPSFLLRDGTVDLQLGQDSTSRVAARVTGLTTQPALYGRPATLAASGRIGGATPLAISVRGQSDHTGRTPTDSVIGRIEGAQIPGFALAGLPFAVDPGRGTIDVGFTLAGDRVAGHWEIQSGNASWTADTVALAAASTTERIVWQVVNGLRDLRVRADLSGTLANPRLSVQSNLDDALATRFRALAGEQIAGAERRARDAVDQLVNARVGPAQAKVAEFRTLAADRIPLEQRQLDQAHSALEAQLKRLIGSAGGLKLPGF